jgi:hypothetical protein
MTLPTDSSSKSKQLKKQAPVQMEGGLSSRFF